MLPFVGLSFSCLLIAFGAVAWLLFKDRKYWRDQYQALAQEARQREQHLFDEMLRMKGVGPISKSAAPPPTIRHQPALDSEDLEIIDSRIDEHIGAGLVTASEGHSWAKQVRHGDLTPAQIDRMLWGRQQSQYSGSIADID